MAFVPLSRAGASPPSLSMPCGQAARKVRRKRSPPASGSPSTTTAAACSCSTKAPDMEGALGNLARDGQRGGVRAIVSAATHEEPRELAGVAQSLVELARMSRVDDGRAVDDLGYFIAAVQAAVRPSRGRPAARTRHRVRG